MADDPAEFEYPDYYEHWRDPDWDIDDEGNSDPHWDDREDSALEDYEWEDVDDSDLD